MVSACRYKNNLRASKGQCQPSGGLQPIPRESNDKDMLDELIIEAIHEESFVIVLQHVAMTST